MKTLTANLKSSESSRHRCLSSRTVKIVEKALETSDCSRRKRTHHSAFNTFSESESISEARRDSKEKSKTATFKGINKRIENWLKSTEEESTILKSRNDNFGDIFDSAHLIQTHHVDIINNKNEYLTTPQSPRALDSIRLDYEPNFERIGAKSMDLKHFQADNADNVKNQFSSMTGLLVYQYILPMQSANVDCIDVGYDPNTCTVTNGAGLVLLQPVTGVKPSIDNITVGENVSFLQPLQSVNEEDAQIDIETNYSNISTVEEINDIDWEPSSELAVSTLEKEVNGLLEVNMTKTNSCKKEYKKTYCSFCESYVISKHFSWHLQQRHKEKSVVKLLRDTNNKKTIIMNIRNKGNLKLNKRNGTIIPKKCMKVFADSINDLNYMICSKCKGYFRNTYMVRHSKNCSMGTERDQINTAHPKVESFILSLQADYQNYITHDPLRKELLKKLRLDDVRKAVISDPIILEYGKRLLQTAKNIKKRTVVARNKMRECACLLIQAKKLIPASCIVTILDILKPKYFDYLVEAVNLASNFCNEDRTYGAASYALHQGKTLKDLIDIATYLLCKKDQIISLNCSSSILEELKILRNIIENNWAREIGSLALKDLTIKKARDHSRKLLPLTQDVMKLRECCINIAESAVKILKSETSRKHYFILVEASFILLLLHNRKRVGDIQFIELTDVTATSSIEQKDEILRALTETERILTKYYQKIHTIGKGSKELLILIPRSVRPFIDTLVAERFKYVDLSNKYFFTNPNGVDEWINGCYIQSKYSKDCGAKQPKLIRSCKLRKHIATMMQLMDLRKNEIGQLALFMGQKDKSSGSSDEDMSLASSGDSLKGVDFSQEESNKDSGEDNDVNFKRFCIG